MAVRPDIAVVYAADHATLWVDAYANGYQVEQTGPLAVASAVVDFGDGTTGSFSQRCVSPAPRLKADHVYAAAGQYTLVVRSATLCEPAWQLSLDTGEGIQVLPAAPPGTAGWPACTTYQLHMTGSDLGAAAGSTGVLIRLKNVSATGCNLRGYPGLQLVSPTGSLLATHVNRATQGDMLFPAIAVGRVALAPGDVAAFEVGYVDMPFGRAVDEPYDVACPSARWLRVILPQVHQYGTAAIAMGPCNGVVNVSPIYPGRDRLQFS